MGNETPLYIHPHPQMDSGFRRNDEQNQIRRKSREESAACCRDRPPRLSETLTKDNHGGQDNPEEELSLRGR